MFAGAITTALLTAAIGYAAAGFGSSISTVIRWCAAVAVVSTSALLAVAASSPTPTEPLDFRPSTRFGMSVVVAGGDEFSLDQSDDGSWTAGWSSDTASTFVRRPSRDEAESALTELSERHIDSPEVADFVNAELRATR